MPETLFELEKTATSSDLLSGSELDSPVANGILYLWACSTVNTATLEVPQSGHRTGVTALLRKRTDGIPSVRDDPPFVIAVKAGVRPLLILGGTTGTVHVTGRYLW